MFSLGTYLVLLWLLLQEVTVIPSLLRAVLGISSTNVVTFFLVITFAPLMYHTFVRRHAKVLLLPHGAVYPALFFLVIFCELLDACYTGLGAKTAIVVLTHSVILFLVFLGNFAIYDSFQLALRKVLQPYMHLVLAVSIAALVAQFLISAGIVDYQKWQFINQYMKKGTEGHIKQFYSMPYYLSLILTGDEPLRMMGITIVRASGLSIEPHVAAYLAAPFLFMSGFYYEERVFQRYTAVCAVAAFLFFTSSLSFYLAMLIPTLAVILLKPSRFFVLSASSLAALLVGFLALQSTNLGSFAAHKSALSRFDGGSSRIAVQSFFTPLLTAQQPLGYGLFSIRENLPISFVNENRGFLGVYSYLLFVVFSIVAGLQEFLRKRIENFPGAELSLVICYVTVHTTKSPTSLLFFPVTMFMILVVTFWASRPVSSMRNN